MKITQPLIALTLSAAFLAACGADDKPKDTQKETTEAPTTEKATTEKPTTEKATTEKPTTEKPTTEAPTTEAPVTEASYNNVYGALTDPDAKPDGGIATNKKKHILYILGDDNIIMQAEKSFDPRFELNLNTDRYFLEGHAMDFMEEDARKIGQIDDRTFIFESKSLGRQYEVLYSMPDGNVITRLIVTPHEE